VGDLLWANRLQRRTPTNIGTKKDAMKTLRPFVSMLFAASVLAACATPSAPPPRTVTEAQAGFVDLTRGQALEIVLPLNAGTGYAWRLDAEASALVLSGGSSRVTDAKRPGGAIQTLYSYTAVGRGKTDLSFTLKRPWEPDAPSDRKAVFHIKVR
jgi:inhibitor of cysteine peptidase